MGEGGQGVGGYVGLEESVASDILATLPLFPVHMTKILRLFAIAVSFVPLASYALEPTDWLFRASEVLPFQPAVAEIPEASWYEVRTTKLKYALRDLEKRPAVELSDLQARFFAGAQFAREPGKTPYLVRALFNNNWSGHHAVSYQDRVLIVTHSSFGKIVKVDFSPLVVNLDLPPAQVIVRVVAR